MTISEIRKNLKGISKEYLNPKEDIVVEYLQGLKPLKFPTHSFDITGKQICLGDKVAYDFEDNTSSFIVVFEDNAFRKKYPNWDKTLEKPILEYGNRAKEMRLKIVKSYHNKTE